LYNYNGMIEVIKGFANKGTSTQSHMAKAAYLRQRGHRAGW